MTNNSSLFYSENVTQNGSLTPTEHLLVPIIYVGCLCVLGIPGNTLVIAVYGLMRKSSVYRTIILVLGVNDLLVCGITLPFELYTMNNHLSFREKWTCKVFRFLNYLFVHNSILVLLLMAIERYRRVCRPLKVQMSTKIGRIWILFIFLFCLVYTVPNIFIRGIHTVQIYANLTGHECATSDDFINSNIPIIYTSISFFICLGSIAILIIVYFCIGKNIFEHFKFVKSLKTEGKSDHQATVECTANSKSISISDNCDLESVGRISMHSRFSSSFKQRWPSMRYSQRPRKVPAHHSNKSTKIALLITIIFVLSYIPHLVASTMSGIHGDSFISRYLPLSVFHLMQRTYAMNHVVNPFIYGFIDRRFRIECKTVIILIVQKFKCRLNKINK